MVVNTSLTPLARDQFGYEQARHLLNRAGFGGTPRQITAIEKMGLDRAVDFLVDYEKINTDALPEADVDADIIRPATAEERAEYQKKRREARGDTQKLEQIRSEVQRRRNLARAQDRGQMADLRRWWVARMISTPRPLQEKLTLLWHGHFASNHRSVRDSNLMFKQNELFRANANGSFADLARGIVRDPAMIVFLNNNRNNRRKPNENLARELMELFTLGEGNYTEDDIKQGARALTGYTYRDNDFTFNRGMHDPGEKNLLGKRGEFDGDGFVKLCLARESCAQFVSYKLYNFFAGDMAEGPDSAADAVIKQLASQLRADKYEMKTVLKTLFKSQHFYDDAIMGNMIKSPAELVVGSVRTLNTPVRDLNVLSDAMNMMGQRLFDPPTVAGWEGGRSWINTSTLFVRQNLVTYILTGKLPYNDGWTSLDVDYDPTFLLEGLGSRTPAAVADRLFRTVLCEHPHTQRRDEITAFFAQHENKIDSKTTLGALLLTTAMPEYQLC